MSEHKAKSSIQPLTAADFLAGILGEPELFTVPGLGTVKIRPVTSLEAEGVNARGGGDPHKMMRETVRVALVEPVLTDEQFQQLENARAGIIMRLAKRISMISGIDDDPALADLAGGGS